MLVRSALADTVLLTRARAALAGGPRQGPDLLGEVLSAPRASPNLAERLLRALLGEHEEFARDGEGRWCLRSAAETRVAVEDSTPSVKATAFAVVDVETTGGSARNGHRMTEFAAVPVQRGEVGDPYTTLINPERPIPAPIVALTRITPAMVCRAPTFDRIADRILAALRGRVFVAHNAGFDWRFTSFELERARGLQLVGDRLCTVRLARIVMPHLPRRSLDNVARYFGVTIVDRHRAYGDALATARVLTRLLDAAADRGWDTWAALRGRLERRTGRQKRCRTALPRAVDVDPTL